MWGRNARLLAVTVAALALASVSAIWLYWPSGKEVLTVFHAGSLTLPLELLAKEFEAKHGVEVHLEAFGSVSAIRQITELGRRCDVLAVADYKLILELMWPQHADWCILFATNEMVIAYTDESAYSSEIGPDNWPEVLLREDVSIGRSDPAQDPCGYRALLVWKLSETYYGLPGLYEQLLARSPQPTRPKSHDLLLLLQNGQLDYAFIYKSVAVQNGLKFVDLPPEVDLGHEELADTYASASVYVEGLGEVRGEPIRYAITIPKCVEHFDLAVKFVEFLLGDTGISIFTDCGQNPTSPALALGYDAVPQELRAYVVRWEG